MPNCDLYVRVKKEQRKYQKPARNGEKTRENQREDRYGGLMARPKGWRGDPDKPQESFVFATVVDSWQEKSSCAVHFCVYSVEDYISTGLILAFINKKGFTDTDLCILCSSCKDTLLQSTCDRHFDISLISQRNRRWIYALNITGIFRFSWLTAKHLFQEKHWWEITFHVIGMISTLSDPSVGGRVWVAKSCLVR